MSLPAPLTATTGGALALDHDALLLDLDGVVYTGVEAVPGAAEALRWARDAGLAIGYVTNNASRTPAEVAALLTGLGIPAGAEEVVTSAQAAVALLADRVPAGATVLAVGGPGVAAAVTGGGFRPAEPGQRPDAVVQGYGPGVGWADLAEAAYAVAAGAVWVATNTDRTIPTARGIAPGNGTLVAAVAAATGAVPLVAGKPEPALFAHAASRLSAARPLVIGDRLDTDIRGAARAGMASLLVMTGVTTAAELCAAGPGDRPTYLAADLEGLRTPVPAAGSDDGPTGVLRRAALARWAGEERD